MVQYLLESRWPYVTLRTQGVGHVGFTPGSGEGVEKGAGLLVAGETDDSEGVLASEPEGVQDAVRLLNKGSEGENVGEYLRQGRGAKWQAEGENVSL